MATSTGKGYVVRHVATAPTVPCPCGESARLLTRDDTPACNLHVTHITDSERHYHKHSTEVYYILEGRGRMEIGDDVIELEPGVAVYIPPYTRHRVSGDVRTIVFGVPALDPGDEYFD